MLARVDHAEREDGHKGGVVGKVAAVFSPSSVVRFFLFELSGVFSDTYHIRLAA